MAIPVVSRLAFRQKLRVVGGLLLASMLLGSLLASLEMRRANEVCARVTLRYIPAVEAVRDLRLGAMGSASALKSWLLFGSDPAAAARYRTQFTESEQLAGAAAAKIERLRGTAGDATQTPEMTSAMDAWRALDASEERVLAYPDRECDRGDCAEDESSGAERGD